MTEFVDVIIVGAGISGISAAWHLQQRCPDKSYVILERRDNLGGTWDLFKYPGLRSDSDMYTLGFRFKPYLSEQAIAEGPSILNYLKEAAAENGIDKHMRFGQNVVAADWSDADNRWTLRVEADGQQREIACSFVIGCTGYYNYDEGYLPEFAGADDFEGQIVHPQHWPEDLDYQGKKIVVIGSGATAVTLIPALIASGSGHVTMLQRSPTYIAAMPDKDPFVAKVSKVLPEKAAYAATRWKAIIQATVQYQIARKFPNFFKNALRKMGERRLPEDFDWDKHFTPTYKPWDQRVCLAPNGDLFKAIRKGKADVVTDTIDRFTTTGIKLTSGEELHADIIVTATGLNMQLLGGLEPTKNGEPIDLPSLMTYKGCMFSGIPNFVMTFGYTNASWTLKADLVSEFTCRLLNYMDDNGFDRVEPQHPGDAVDEMPFMDFSPGYFKRAEHLLPKSGSRAPWRLKQNYLFDMRMIRYGKVDEESLHFTKHRAPVAASV
ncbi:FAD-containing monooxygenase EthA [Mycolicibacterium agri]|uniref:FAD-containing monooxygenase EthA n=1 Tax=Mycolicibacterium agri TaxID=36811 RepID=A0A2A7MU39_MYCAG|nr:NAD(P)/FAD-dependent oxidoreductase [Mycolicibacterium agri]PEG35070.1 FAD-containing monooxygenase EthA [Mycolicibacterium agri]GFG53741.1 FAD-containing monooxygenase EthA [Mycolicibacterium agri]